MIFSNFYKTISISWLFKEIVSQKSGCEKTTLNDTQIEKKNEIRTVNTTKVIQVIPTKIWTITKVTIWCLSYAIYGVQKSTVLFNG